MAEAKRLRVGEYPRPCANAIASDIIAKRIAMAMTDGSVTNVASALHVGTCSIGVIGSGCGQAAMSITYLMKRLRFLDNNIPKPEVAFVCDDEQVPPLPRPHQIVISPSVALCCSSAGHPRTGLGRTYRTGSFKCRATAYIQ